jgi:predicted  nucleic acid-binding Zn-ribbon protein
MKDAEILDTLVELQKVDTKIQNIEKEKAKITEQVATYQAELEVHKAAFAEKKARLNEFKKRKAEIDLKIKAINDDVAKKESQTSQIKTNEAFKAIQSEIQTAKDAVRRYESQLLEVMEEEEEVQKWVKEQEIVLKREDERTNLDIANVAGEIKIKDDEIAVIRIERDAKAILVDKTWLGRYEKIRANKGGLAVAAVTRDARGDGSCSGCRMSVTAQMVIQLKKKLEIQTCPNCARIWYADDSK